MIPGWNEIDSAAPRSKSDPVDRFGEVLAFHRFRVSLRLHILKFFRRDGVRIRKVGDGKDVVSNRFFGVAGERVERKFARKGPLRIEVDFDSAGQIFAQYGVELFDSERAFHRFPKDRARLADHAVEPIAVARLHDFGRRPKFIVRIRAPELTKQAA